MALFFFMGKYRSKLIKIEEQNKVKDKNVRKTFDYSIILTYHLQKQAKNLCNAFILCDGWRVILHDSDETNYVSSNDIYYYLIKCYYLDKLYKCSILQHNQEFL